MHLDDDGRNVLRRVLAAVAQILHFEVLPLRSVTKGTGAGLGVFSS